MKKPYILAIAVVMALSMCACRGRKPVETTAPTTRPTSAPTTVPTTAPTTAPTVMPTIPEMDPSSATNIPDSTVDHNSTENTIGMTEGTDGTGTTGETGVAGRARGGLMR